MIKNFKFNVLIRIVIICILIALLLYFIFVEIRILRSVYLGVFLVISIVEFVWYVDRTNRDFTSFLLALLQDDFTTTFSESDKGKSFNELYAAFNKITKKFEQISSAKEAQHIYLEALVDHVRVGIISIDKNEKIHLMNQALQKMLNRPHMAFLNNLSSIDPNLTIVLRDIKPKENKLLKIIVNQDLLQLSIHASEFLLGDQYYKLISVQNIKNELDANELDAWQKLIRVLTHEIMNSVTPITSLSGSLKQLVEAQKETNETFAKVSMGLNAIELRSRGLQNFTDAYRKLTKIPSPNFTQINFAAQLNSILILQKEELSEVKVVSDIPEDLVIFGDRDLLDQVLINLIKNAADALHEQAVPKINIRAWTDAKTHITITDNGHGIADEKIDKIFIPFFTTKEDGSGIGLPLCRQIIRLHNGNITVASKLNKGTTFALIL